MLPAPLADDLRRYVEALARHFEERLVSVVLFGSWVRGATRPESDLDLLVVIRDLPSDRFERHRTLYQVPREVSEAFAEVASPIALTPAEAERVKPYYLGMLSGHVLLHDAGGFFAGILERLRQRLGELGARRYVDKNGYEYWDLKPDWKPGDVVVL